MPSISTPSGPITQAGFDEIRRLFTEKFFSKLEELAGGYDALLSMTRGKSDGQIHYIVDNLLNPGGQKDNDVCYNLLDMATIYLLDWSAMLEALEANIPSDSDCD